MSSSPAWMDLAECRKPGADPEWWFPAGGAAGDKARYICSRCAVSLPCLLHAAALRAAHGPLDGIWGGVSFNQVTRGMAEAMAGAG